MSEPAAPPALPIVAAPTPTPPPTAPAGNDLWYQGYDADTIGYLQQRGLDRKTAIEAVAETIKAHRAAEKFVGVPTDQLIRMPQNAADEAGWKNLWTKIGKPAEAKDYDFTAVKRADGTALDDNFANFMREKSFALNLPKDTAWQMASEFAKYQDGIQVSVKADRDAKLIEERKALDTNWGKNKEANMFVAKAGAAVLGLGPEDVAALEGTIGYAKVMEAMRRVGVLNKEDAFVAGSGSTSGGVMTREQAISRMAELSADKAFSAKLIAGDAESGRQWKALQIIRAG